MDHGVGIGQLEDLALSTQRRDEAGGANAIEERRYAFFPSLQFRGETDSSLKGRVASEGVNTV